MKDCCWCPEDLEAEAAEAAADGGGLWSEEALEAAKAFLRSSSSSSSSELSRYLDDWQNSLTCKIQVWKKVKIY